MSVVVGAVCDITTAPKNVINFSQKFAYQKINF